MALVMFIMHLLSQDGLGARNVFNTACDAMTKEGYFVPNVAVLDRNFMAVFLSDSVMVNSLSRIAENWKTTVRRKSILLKTSLLPLFPGGFTPPDDDVAVILRQVTHSHVMYLNTT